jgi:hypothetical protein
MRIVRRHLRRGVAAWFVCHALAFSALAPRDCCAAHGHRETAAPACHEATPPADACQLTGACDAPAAALSAVLLQGATLVWPGVTAPRGYRSDVSRCRDQRRLVRLVHPPDAPPPRF